MYTCFLLFSYFVYYFYHVKFAQPHLLCHFSLYLLFLLIFPLCVSYISCSFYLIEIPGIIFLEKNKLCSLLSFSYSLILILLFHSSDFFPPSFLYLSPFPTHYLFIYSIHLSLYFFPYLIASHFSFLITIALFPLTLLFLIVYFVALLVIYDPSFLFFFGQFSLYFLKLIFDRLICYLYSLFFFLSFTLMLFLRRLSVLICFLVINLYIGFSSFPFLFSLYLIFVAVHIFVIYFSVNFTCLTFYNHSSFTFNFPCMSFFPINSNYLSFFIITSDRCRFYYLFFWFCRSLFLMTIRVHL